MQTCMNPDIIHVREFYKVYSNPFLIRSLKISREALGQSNMVQKSTESEFVKNKVHLFQFGSCRYEVERKCAIYKLIQIE